MDLNDILGQEPHAVKAVAVIEAKESGARVEIAVGIIGWTGTGLLLAAYGLLTARRLSASGRPYQLMNLIGGLALMINTAYYSAWPSAALNLVWFGIGLVGLLSARKVQRT